MVQIYETQTGYYLPDVLGSVRQMTSPTGEVQLSQRFTPFGEVKEKYGDGEANFGYTAQKYDAQTGLLYLRARYYAPGTGRFISHDTWSGDSNSPMSFNPWLYVYGNPINHNDASGMCTDDNYDGICDAIYYPSKVDITSPFVYFDESEGKFTDDDKFIIETAALDVANAYAKAFSTKYYLPGMCNGNKILIEAIASSQNVGPLTALITIHGGKITFKKHNSDVGYTGRSESRVLIHVYAQGTLSKYNYNYDKFRRVMVHEIGHSFENAMIEPLGDKMGRALISKRFTYLITPKTYYEIYDKKQYITPNNEVKYYDYTRENSGDYYGFAGGSDWQFRLHDYNTEYAPGADIPYYVNGELAHDEKGNQLFLTNGWNEFGSGEIFADMFVGWVYDAWGDNALGKARANFMNDNMPRYIREIYRYRTGVAE